MTRAATIHSAIVLLCIFICACGGSNNQPATIQGAPIDAAVQPASQGLPDSLPADGVQPWERLDADGYVIPQERSALSINASTDFTPGVERFQESGDAADNLEATRLNGTDDSSTSYAMYRVTMGAEQPGVVSVDANLLSGSGYYVGLSDYTTDRWDWRGPFTDSHVRLQAVVDATGELTSTLGNTFVTVLVPAGSSIDVVGIGINQYDLADATPPAVPAGLTAAAVPGGIELSWSQVLENDLAGYAVYYSNKSFISPESAGVQHVSYLEGSTMHLLSGLKGKTFVAISAIDFGGNASTLSSLQSASPLPGPGAKIDLETDRVSGGINEAIVLSASGAASYDWDLDGDGVFEITGDTIGSQAAYTGATGIIRPRVRGIEGEAVALGGLSLIITGNTRPVASAVADVYSGKAPLDVNFSGTAEDSEDNPSQLTYAWDLDGDGIYENNTNSLTVGPVRYTLAGTVNPKFRVTDSGGAWDVDTVTVNVMENLQPVAVLTVEGGKRQPAPFLAEFDVSGCFDPDGSIAVYDWDWENDGTFDLTDGSAVAVTHVYPEIGVYELKLRVRDADGGSDETVISLVAQGWKLVTVNSGDDVGKYNSLAVVDGNPAISYFNETTDTLKYARSDTATGENTGDWQDIITVDATSGSGAFGTSLVVVQNTPAIAYNRTGGLNDLMYVRSASNTGEQQIDWGTPVLVEDVGFTGQYPDMEIVNGNPAIAYYDQNSPGLKFIRSNSDKGEDPLDWSVSINVDISGNVGGHPSLAIVDGNPAISYYDYDNNRLLYARSTNKFGTFASDWTQKVILTGGGFTGDYSSLAVVNGSPGICYSDESNKYLMYITCDTADGAQANDWLGAVTVDTVNSPGTYCSLLEFNSRPLACSFSADDTGLRVVKASGSGRLPADWEPARTIDDYAYTGQYSSMALVQGKVAIAYYSFSGGNLRYAIRYE